MLAQLAQKTSKGATMNAQFWIVDSLPDCHGDQRHTEFVGEIDVMVIVEKELVMAKELCVRSDAPNHTPIIAGMLFHAIERLQHSLCPVFFLWEINDHL